VEILSSEEQGCIEVRYIQN